VQSKVHKIEDGSMAAGQAVVTGAAGGIGSATCARLAAAGFDLAVVDADEENLVLRAESLRQTGVRVDAYVVDLTDPEQVRETVTSILARGPVEVLVNNAGIAVRADVPSTEPADWYRIFGVNVHAIFELSRHVVPAMAEAGGGVIVNIASVAALVGIPQRAAYCASKGAVVGLTRAMAVDHAQDNIRVNAVCPGTVQTGWIDSILAGVDDPSAARTAMENRQLLGRMGTPEEIADAVFFLVDNSFATGSVLVLDGGMTAT
jgi:NAD(P)-dependent dehydrogenase (short-subunit alcohol dehydrogenase family)